MKQSAGIRKWAGIFICTYFFLYIFPFPLEWIPFQIGLWIDTLIDDFWKWLTPLVARELFNFEGLISTNANGSGDTTFHYFKLALQFGLAIICSLVLFYMDRRRNKLSFLWPYIHLYIRYYLAVTLLGYGFAKVIPNQFPGPGLSDLVRPFGEISPMGLLWKFMGYSVPYIVFTGIMEVLAGMFLFFRRTVKLGALLSFAVMLNVFLLNLFYDVPVKLFSLHLLILSAFILFPYYGNLWRFLVTNRETKPIEHPSYFKAGRFQRIGYILKGLFIFFASIIILSNSIESSNSYGRRAAKPPLYGIYEVERFIYGKDTIPAVLGDSIRWRRLIVDRFNVGVHFMNGEIKYAAHNVDTIQQSLKIKPYRETQLYTFKYKLQDSLLILNGVRGTDSLKIECAVRNPEDFYLLKRGFHWINEYPNNR